MYLSLKKAVRVCLTAVLVAALAQAAFASGSTESSASAASSTTSQEVLHMPANGTFDNLDPAVLTSVMHQLVQFAIFEPLVRTYKGKIEPGMAKSWEVSKDGLVYTFHLRNAEWSDGQPVTGTDFVNAFVRLFQISPASPIFDVIKNGAELRAGKVQPSALGVKAPDAHTVVITLGHPAPYFMQLIGSSFGSPTREDLIKKYGDGYGASAGSMAYNGPFILKEWKHSDHLTLVKNPNYWNASAIKLNKVIVYVLPDASTQRNLFDTGKLDYYIPRSEAEAKAYEAKGLLHTYVAGGISDIQLNRHGENRNPIKAKILSDPDFMKAISYAIDRKGYIDNVLQGDGYPATVQTPPSTAIYPGKTWGQVSTNIGKYHPVTADLAKSKAYMDKVLKMMGYTSVSQLPTFDFLTMQSPDTPKSMAGYLLGVFQQMGLKIHVTVATGKQYWNDLYKPALAYDLTLSGWGPDYNDPYTYMQYWRTSSTDMGTTFENAQFDKLLAEANNTTDLVKRAAILNQAEALFSNIAPCIPLTWNKGMIAIQPWVKGITTAISGMTINYLYAQITK